jgi:hypothetical protein
MRVGTVVAFCFLIMAGISCEKNPASNDGFKDSLTLGTGMSGFTLTGASTTFTRIGGSLQLYWRLESAADMAGSDVTITITPVSGGSPVSQTYAHLQSYGHIMLSSINVTAAGSYRATGILVTGNKTVASVDFTVN